MDRAGQPDGRQPFPQDGQHPAGVVRGAGEAGLDQGERARLRAGPSPHAVVAGLEDETADGGMPGRQPSGEFAQLAACGKQQGFGVFDIGQQFQRGGELQGRLEPGAKLRLPAQRKIHLLQQGLAEAACQTVAGQLRQVAKDPQADGIDRIAFQPSRRPLIRRA